VEDPFPVIRLLGAFGGLFGGALVERVLGFYSRRITKRLAELL
jgi:hypothetical protein